MLAQRYKQLRTDHHCVCQHESLQKPLLEQARASALQYAFEDKCFFKPSLSPAVALAQ